MACHVASSVVDNSTVVDTPEGTEEVLGVCAPLVVDQPDGPPADRRDDEEEFAEEQGLLARLVHLLRYRNSISMITSLLQHNFFKFCSLMC